MGQPQPGILPEIPAFGQHMGFTLQAGNEPAACRAVLEAIAVDTSCVIGIGQPLVTALGAHIEGLRSFPALAHQGLTVPATQDALWVWVRGDDPSDIAHSSRSLRTQLRSCFVLARSVDTVRTRERRDFSGYVDGTENPRGDDAMRAAVLDAPGDPLDGSSFAAVQQWQHDLDRFERHAPSERDAMIGRKREDDVELDDAPASSHVKRTAQESFSPEAFVLRRSMPWMQGERLGLLFVAFGHSLDAFEVQLRRMLGMDDDIADALFRFTQPLTGAYYWCPPVQNDRLDLRALDP